MKLLSRGYWRSLLPAQLLLVMRITTALLLIGALHVSATGLGQTVSYSGKNVRLEQVFAAIEQQTGYGFFYKLPDLQDAKPVTVALKNVPLPEALAKILQYETLDFSIQGNTIVISLKTLTAGLKPAASTLSSPPPGDIHGHITDSLGTPLIGATIQIKGSNRFTTTDENGYFSYQGLAPDAVLVVSFVGYQSRDIPVAARRNLSITLNPLSKNMGSVEVVLNNGFQRISKERSTGAYGTIDQTLLDREVATNVLSKLNGNATGLYFGPSVPTAASQISTNLTSRNLGITVRGVSTLSAQVGTNPLIVLDNFPYEGDINNLNPNDIESVTILKDAAAASIWGARAGNGVIVLTSKKGRFNHPLQMDFTANVTIINKPPIFKDPNYLDANDYINVEDSLFSKGYYTATIANTSSWPVLSPVVTLLAQQAAGQITASQATTQINALRSNDLRRDTYNSIYQKAINQQYSLGLRGGSENMDYSVRFGTDQNRGSSIRTGSNRTTVDALADFTPLKNLEINTAINYAQAELMNNNPIGYLSSYPYAKLKNPDGSPATVTKTYRESYIDSVEKLGFLDWEYRPLDEIKNSDNTTHTNDLMLRVGAKYKFTSYLSAELQYENESVTYLNRVYYNDSTYYTRNLINQYSQYNRATNSFTYNFPLGGVLNTQTTTWNTYDYRGQITFNKPLGRQGNLSAIAGGDIHQIVTRGFNRNSYGYDANFGTSNNALNFSTAYPLNPNGYGLITAPDGSLTGSNLSYLSYYANAAYTYKEKYTLSLSGREDGSNIFGVKTNDRITPLWSAGGSWDASRESFYHLDILPLLKLRATYGFNGNVYNGSAYVTGQYTSDNQTGATVIDAITAPNPSLSWERVRNINLGIDFALKKNFLYGSIDVYKKDGQNLIEPVSLAPSVGFSSFSGNRAATDTKGIELTLNSKILDGKFKWYTTLIANVLKDKVTRWDAPIIASTIRTNGGLVALKGRPLYSIFGYKWDGLDPTDGDPQGILNGKVSKDYTDILNNYQPDSLAFAGSARPTKWGTLRNDFMYKGFSLSFMLAYKMGFYFRRPSITGNLSDLVTGLAEKDYTQRWRQPGDEKTTNIPSEVYPSNPNRTTFYQYSQALITSGNFVRMQDVRLAYDLSKWVRNSAFSSLQIYSYANNLGILWRANKFGLDPDTFGSYPNPFSISFGIQASLK